MSVSRAGLAAAAVAGVVLPRTMLDSLDPAQRDLWCLESSTTPAVGDGEDRTRQEFKDECDVNFVLRQYGVREPRGGPLRYGVEVDDAVDMQAMYANVASIADAYRASPALFRKAYPTLESLIAALAAGEVDASLWREEAAAAAAADSVKAAASAAAEPAQ